MSTEPPLRRSSPLGSDVAHFETLVIVSHPEHVSTKIDVFRKGLDASGEKFFFDNSADRRDAVLKSLERYFGVEVGFGALTHGTTVGLAQVLGGVKIAPGQEILTSRNEHAATLETLRVRIERDRTPFRQVPLFRDSRTVSEDEILMNIEMELRPWTRVLALTWVYSSDGVKLPIKAIAELVARENRTRSGPENRLLLVVDGVHGFGIEDTTFPALACDFFIAGCHKSIFGPRGTGVICGTADAWPHVVPWTAKLSGFDGGPAARHMPGGVKCFEHFWALDEAFDFLSGEGKADVQDHVYRLASQFKKGLASISGVTVVTPMTPDFSSGLVCFDVRSPQTGRTIPAHEVVGSLRSKENNIIATESAWDATSASTHVRFAISLLNDAKQVEQAIRAIARIAGSQERS